MYCVLTDSITGTHACVCFLDLSHTLPFLSLVISLPFVFSFHPFLLLSLCSHSVELTTFCIYLIFPFRLSFLFCLLPFYLFLSFSLGLTVLVPDLTSRPRSPPQPPPPPLPPGRPPPPTPPQERVTDVEAVGGAVASGPEECEERERDTPLRQLEGTEAEEREGGRARAIDNQYSFF